MTITRDSNFIGGQWRRAGGTEHFEVTDSATEEIIGTVTAATAAGVLARRAVQINDGAFNICAPFGGYGQSGNGREFGRWGLEEFLETKSMQLP